ncbi:MAG: imidazole glycerol phosphate synthase subunit HisH [Thermomicrobiales bacterium]|nr:imidazole glycerol phosphate synthase subunit HisH [Thermomicrobiales bacterium]
MIAIIDYGAGNLRSIRRALEINGAETVITSDADVIRKADAVVLPGVGHAGHAIGEIDRRGLTPAIRETVEAGKPFLGICVGMQVLFEHQEEGDTQGFGFLRGDVRSIEGAAKLPHIGWNRVEATETDNTLDEGYFYFVHSFVANPTDPEDIAATSTYGECFPVVVKSANVWGTQFHPEKSGPAGIEFLASWVNEVDRATKERWAAGE